MHRVVNTNLEDMIRRGLDFVLATIGLVLLSPVMVIIGVLIRRNSPGPAIFVQERVGMGGRSFRLRKFRSMRRDASEGPSVTAAGDARITSIGARLRSTKLDELPQLLNVAQGDMAMVGPRPEVRRYVELWSEEQRRIILSVRPGITDPVTLQLRREEELLGNAEDPEKYYQDVLLPRKVMGYEDYVRNRSLVGDMRIIVRTVWAVVRS